MPCPSSLSEQSELEQSEVPAPPPPNPFPLRGKLCILIISTAHLHSHHQARAVCVAIIISAVYMAVIISIAAWELALFWPGPFPWKSLSAIIGLYDEVLASAAWSALISIALDVIFMRGSRVDRSSCQRHRSSFPLPLHPPTYPPTAARLQPPPPPPTPLRLRPPPSFRPASLPCQCLTH